jgi:hypothetical protein
VRPVYRTGFYGGYGWSRGFYGSPCGRWGSYGQPWFGVAPQVDYVPYRTASVLFKRGLVDSWERVR